MSIHNVLSYTYLKIADELEETFSIKEPRWGLTDKELMETFPQAKQFMSLKVRELKTERETIVNGIAKDLEHASKHDPASYEVSKEWTKLTLGAQLTNVDRNLSRLSRLKQLFRGNVHKPGITEDMIQRAKSIPIEDLTGMEMRRQGKLIRGSCPFHEDKTPSFFIFPDNHCWCFGCHRGGDTISYAQLKFGYSFPQAVTYLVGAAA